MEKERNCQKCIHHISGLCCKWDCEMTTLEDYRDKVIDEFADRLSKYLNVESATKYGNKNAEQQRNSYDTLMKYEIADAIDDVAEQMKAGDNNE